MLGNLKVCIVSYYFYPVYSGPALRFYNYIPYFQEKGVNICIITANNLKSGRKILEKTTYKVKKLGENLSYYKLREADVYQINLPQVSHARRLWLFFKLQRKIILKDKRLENIVINYLSSSLPGVWHNLQIKRPSVFTYTLLGGNLSLNPLKRFIQKKLTWSAPFWPHDVVVVSSSVMKSFLENTLGLKQEIRVIPNGVDVKRFHPPTQEEKNTLKKKLLGFGNDHKIVLTISSVVPRKGIDIILEAWRMLEVKFPKSHLVIVGQRFDLTDKKYFSYHKMIEGIMRSLRHPANVHFVGLQSNPEEWLKAADIFVFASKREGMPNVLLEALATGLPTVTVKFIGFPEEIGQDGEHLILSDRNPEALYKNVDIVLSNLNLSKKIGLNAYKRTKEIFSIERSVAKYIELYEHLLRRYHPYKS